MGLATPFSLLSFVMYYLCGKKADIPKINFHCDLISLAWF